MTLTEEQRDALLRAAHVLRYYVNDPDSIFRADQIKEDTIVLQAMIDSSEHIREPPKMVTFDLEKARAVDIDLLAATDWGELRARYRAALAEIERMQSRLDESEQIIAQETKSSTRWFDELLQVQNGLAQSRRVIYQRDAKIKELEDALSEYQRLGKTIAGRVPCLVPHGDCGRCSADAREVCGALEQIADGKIGPDANPRRCPHVEEGDYIRDPTTCSIVTIKDAEIGTSDHIVETDQMAPNGKHWQITEEQKDVLRFLLSGEFSRDCGCDYCRRALETVRAMLEEGA